MKKNRRITRPMAIGMAFSIFLASCTSVTMIRSKPSGAKVYLDGQYVGDTPYRMSDTKVSGTCTSVKLELGGAEADNTICRNERADVGAIVGGCFLLFPFLWTMGYNPEHTYELNGSGPRVYEEETPQVKTTHEEVKRVPKGNRQSKADKLWELKQLYDEKVITKEEFEKEKKKILEKDDK